ncbi:MAG: Holliday junction resolvase RuvX [Planctomycetes bacterium]|nr:Holliday junction resolvase RuvX [Planctomycetota bacterium]
MRYLGVDFGEKRVGLAITDQEGMIASPLTILKVKSPEDALRQVLATIREYKVDLVVLGYARRMDGRVGAKARECETFAKSLRGEGLLVELWDERLSSVQAERSLREADLSHHKRKQHLDAVAAQMILQSYLQAKS